MYNRMDTCPRDRVVIFACPETNRVSGCRVPEIVGCWTWFPYPRWRQYGGILDWHTLKPLGWREVEIPFDDEEEDEGERNV